MAATSPLPAATLLSLPADIMVDTVWRVVAADDWPDEAAARDDIHLDSIAQTELDDPWWPAAHKGAAGAAEHGRPPPPRTPREVVLTRAAFRRALPPALSCGALHASWRLLLAYQMKALDVGPAADSAAVARLLQSLPRLTAFTLRSVPEKAILTSPFFQSLLIDGVLGEGVAAPANPRYATPAAAADRGLMAFAYHGAYLPSGVVVVLAAPPSVASLRRLTLVAARSPDVGRFKQVPIFLPRPLPVTGLRWHATASHAQ